ncbi:hypothetical protein, partial [Myceligenerans crystallogenes]|uniref:hypothetical protein n=1 Tax=Myceligenerans crystallogenes TaxID=316335 RepID=UPI0031E1521C
APPSPTTTPSSAPSGGPPAWATSPGWSPAPDAVAEPGRRQEAGPRSFAAGSARLPESVEVGEEITAQAVGFSPSPQAVTCTWSVGGIERQNLGSCTYVVALADVGSVIQARVTATRDGYERRSELTGFTAPVPRPRVRTPRCEITLWEAERSSRWGDASCRVDQDPEVTYEWRWRDLDTGEVVGEAEVQTQDRVWVRSEHEGHAIRCTVTARRDGYASGEWVAEARIPEPGGLEVAGG